MQLQRINIKKLGLVVLLIIACHIGRAQLSRTHYIPPITAAPNGNALPQNQYLHISTPSSTPTSVSVNQLGTGVVNYSVSNATPLEIYIGNGDNRTINQIADLFDVKKEYIEPVLEPKETLADIKLAKDLLNWEPTTSVDSWIKQQIIDYEKK